MPSGLLLDLLVGLGLFIAGLTAGGYGIHEIDQAKYDQLVIDQKNAVIQAQQIAALTQKNQDIVVQQSAVTEAKAQQAIQDKANGLPTIITKRVPVSVPCVPIGFVRVINYAATDTNPDTGAAGQSDNACTSISWRALADDLTDDYLTGNKNAEQLNALISFTSSLHDITEKSQPILKPSWWQRNFGG